jgi:hypothetical protein
MRHEVKTFSPHRPGDTAMNLAPRLIWIASMVTAVLTGCMSSENRNGEPVRVELQATRNNVGRIGYATLSPIGETTGVNAFVSGVQGSLRPVRLYTYIYTGSCSQMGAKPVYELNDRVTTHRTKAGWEYSRTAPVPLSELRSTKHALLVRSSPPEGSAALFCGDIP